MTVLYVKHFEQLVNSNAADKGKDNEQKRSYYNSRRVYVRRLKADNKRKHHYPDNVIDYRRTHYCRADPPLQLSKLAQSLNGNADRGCRHNRSYEYRLVKALAAPRLNAVKSHIKQRAADQRYKHAHTRHQKRYWTGFHKLLQIGFKTRGKHYDYHAYLRHLRKKVGLAYQSEN